MFSNQPNNIDSTHFQIKNENVCVFGIGYMCILNGHMYMSDSRSIEWSEWN